MAPAASTIRVGKSGRRPTRNARMAAVATMAALMAGAAAPEISAYAQTPLTVAICHARRWRPTVAAPMAARMPATSARFDPLTAVRWVVPVLMNASCRPGEKPASSPVTSPESSTPASPGAARRSVSPMLRAQVREGPRGARRRLDQVQRRGKQRSVAASGHHGGPMRVRRRPSRAGGRPTAAPHHRCAPRGTRRP